jgi:hypothetical protein
MERLRDNDRDWGLTRIEFTQREKRRLREREKKRKQRANAATVAVRTIKESLAPVFVTSSGMLAVRRMIPNKSRIPSTPSNWQSDFIAVSLPYVAFLDSPLMERTAK